MPTGAVCPEAAPELSVSAAYPHTGGGGGSKIAPGPTADHFSKSAFFTDLQWGTAFTHVPGALAGITEWS